MIKKKRKGAALLVVILVMAVLVILGTAILNISLSETNQAAYEDKRMQAHYLARSGAEAALSAWENSSEADKPSGAAETVYLDSSNQFVDTSTNMIGKFDVTVTSPAGANTDTVITSIGTVGNVTQTVTVTIKTTTSQVPVPPLSLSDALLGHSLDWYDFTSGQINTEVHPSAPSGKTVKFEAKGGKGLKLPNKNSPAVTYQADKMVFISPVQTLHNTITLISNIIVFNSTVDFSNKNEKEKLVLKYPSPGGFNISGTTYGVVYFQNVGYYFQNGVELKTQSDITSKLIKIPITDITNYNNPYLSGNTQTISTYSIIWN
jgi:Tfp pilus assembly protein PilX